MFSFVFHFASTMASSLFPITSPVVIHWVSTYSASNFCRIIIVPNYISSCDMLGINLLSFNSAMSLFNSRIIIVPNYISSCDTLDIDSASTVLSHYSTPQPSYGGSHNFSIYHISIDNQRTAFIGSENLLRFCHWSER